MRRYWLLAGLAGCVWGLFAYVPRCGSWERCWGRRHRLAVIGLIVARIYCRCMGAPAASAGHGARDAILAAMLSAWAPDLRRGAAVANRLRMPSRTGRVGHALGRDGLGIVLFLWPLTYATHWLLGRVSGIG